MARDNRQKVAQESGNQLPPVKEPVKEADNPYEFTDLEKEEYGAYNLQHPIARAWARAKRQGADVGPPIADVQVRDDDQQSQLFQFAIARLDAKVERNPNRMVGFFDGHGKIIEESGL